MIVFCKSCGSYIPQEHLEFRALQLCERCYNKQMDPNLNSLEPGDLINVKGMKGEFKVIRVEKKDCYVMLELLSLEKKDIKRITSPPHKIIKLRDPIEKLKEGSIDKLYELELFVGAKTLSQIHQYDRIISLEVSKIDAVPHQIEAVYRALSEPMPRRLMADDVGLGKTIEAGMILKELKLRGRVNNALIVVPAGLKYQWQRELSDRFREDFVLIDSGYPGNPWKRERFVIASMDWAKKKENLKQLEPIEWDIVVIDEAHKLKAYEKGLLGERQTWRYRLGHLLSNNAKSLLLLTATPHSGDSFAFYKLLSLIDPYLFSSKYDISREKLKRVMIRRLKEDAKDFDGSDLFLPREVKSLSVKFTDIEMALYNQVTDYVRYYFNLAKAGGHRGVSFAMVILQKRMASSITAIKKSLERRKERLSDLLERPEEILSEKEIKLIETWFKDPDLLEEGEREKLESKLELLTLAKNPVDLKREIQELESLVKLADDVQRQAIDTKARTLLDFVKEIHKKDPTEKILIFTEFTDTLYYLKNLFEKEGYIVTKIHGAMNPYERKQEEERFKEDENVKIMVATDAAGEGINLQFARLMLNYELPWNPNRIEQRMGRLHRYGQKRKVYIYNLLIDGTIEGYIFSILLQKVETIRREMGERVIDVLGTLLQGVRLEEIIMDLIIDRRQAERRVEEVMQKIDERAKMLLKELEEKLLIKDILDIPLINEVMEVHKKHLVTEDDIEYLVHMYFLLNGGQIKELKNRSYEILKLPRTLERDLDAVKSIVSSVGFKRIAFSNGVARKAHAEWIALGHPLLNGIVNDILSRYGRLATVGFDSRGRSGAFLFFNGSIEDGNGEVHDEKLISFFYDAQTSSLQEIDLHCLQDLESPPEDFSFRRPSFDIEEVARKAEGYAVQLFAKILNKTKTKVEHKVNIKKKDLDDFINKRILNLDKEIKNVKYEINTRKIRLSMFGGKNDRLQTEIKLLSLKKERLIKERERIEQEVDERRKKLEGELILNVIGPELVGIALVLPKIDGISDKEVEVLGMKVALEYEKSFGREPKDVSTEFRGYDIESKGRDGEERYIEVKSFKETGQVEMTWHEWLMARKLGENYWLYVVEGCTNQTTARLFMIKNPFALFHEHIKVVTQPKVIIENWKSQAKISSNMKH